MNLTDAKIALVDLDVRQPDFFIFEALRDGELVSLACAQVIVGSLEEANRVAPRALKELLRDGRR